MGTKHTTTIAVCLLLTAPMLALSAGAIQVGQWSGAGLIEFNDLGDTGSPRLAVSADGTALAVWTQFAPEYNQTLAFASHFEAVAGWSTPVVITRDRAAPVTGSSVAMDAYGNGIAVWTQDGAGGPDVWEAPYYAGAGWGVAQRMDTTDTEAVSQPDVAMSDYGQAVVTWVQYDTMLDSYLVWGRILWGSYFATPEKLVTASAVCSDPQAVMGNSGNAIVVYMCDQGYVRDYASVFDGIIQSWVTPVALSSTTGNAVSPPRIAMDASDNATVVWAQEDTGGSFGTKVYQYQFVHGYFDDVSGVGYPGGWTNAATVENATGRATEPDVAVDGIGGAVAVWTVNGSPSTVWLAERSPTGSWGSPTNIGFHSTRDSSHPRVSENGMGYGVVAFDQGGYLFTGIGERYFGWNCCAQMEFRLPPTLGTIEVGTDGSGTSIVMYENTDDAVRNLHVTRYTMQDYEAPSLVILDPASYGSETDRPFVTISGTSDPLASIYVNGYTSSASVTGAFSIVVPLAAGNNVLIVRASDARGNYVETSLEVQFNDPLPVLEMNLTAALAQVDALNAQLADTNAQLVAAQQAVDAAQAQLAVVEGTATATQSDLQAAQADLANAQAALADLQGQQSEIQIMIDDAQANVDAQALALAAAQAQVAALTASLAATSAALNSTSAALQSTNASLASANGRIDALASSGAGPSQADVDAANSAASTAMLVGLLGIIIGGAGVGTSFMMGRRGGGGGGGSGGSGGMQRTSQQAQAAAKPAGDKGSGGSAEPGGGGGPAEHGG